MQPFAVCGLNYSLVTLPNSDRLWLSPTSCMASLPGRRSLILRNVRPSNITVCHSNSSPLPSLPSTNISSSCSPITISSPASYSIHPLQPFHLTPLTNPTPFCSHRCDTYCQNHYTSFSRTHPQLFHLSHPSPYPNP